MKFDKFYIYVFSFLILISDLILCVKSQSSDKPFNLKIVPSRMNKLTLDDLDQIKMEVLHDMNSQLKDLEDDMGEKQRLKEKTSSSWSITGAPIFLPRDPNERGKMIPSKNKMYQTSNQANEKFSQNMNQLLNFKELEDQLHEADEVLDDLKKLKSGKGKKNKKVKTNPEVIVKDEAGKKSISTDIKENGKVENAKINNNNSTKTKILIENKISNSTKITDTNKKPEYEEIDIKKKISETIEPFEKELKKLLNMNSFGDSLIFKFNKTGESSGEDKTGKISKASEKKEQKEKENDGAENKNDIKLEKEKRINAERNEDNNQKYKKQKEQLNQAKKLNQELQKATSEFEINEKASNKKTEIKNPSNISAVPNVSHSHKKINTSNHNVKKESVSDLQKLTKQNHNSDQFSLLEKKTISGSEKINSKDYNKTPISSLNMMDGNFKLPDGPIDLNFMGLM